MLAAVVFDFDDTLTVTDRSRQSLLDDATAVVDAPDLARADYLDAHADHLDADSRTPIFADLLPADADTDPGALAAAYREALGDSLRAIPGVEDLLADLGSRYRLGLLTNGPVRAQGAKLDRFGWVDRFDVVVVTGDLDAGKPDERAFRAVLEDLGVAAEETAYVGDDPETDVAGAKDVGMVAVQVVFEGGPAAHPDADAVVDRDALATDLPAVLDRL